MNKIVEIYTDGACKGNPGPGGWGVLLRYYSEDTSSEKTAQGAEAMTTNNRMELTAVIEGLSLLLYPCQVELYSDSKYVIQGMTEWLDNWKKNQWRTAKKEPVKNDDLWRRLDQCTQQHKIRWHWVKGHSGHPENERADALANEAILTLGLPV